VILGRPDNSIKNHWNSVLKHKQGELAEQLDKYVTSCLKLDKPEDITGYKKNIL